MRQRTTLIIALIVLAACGLAGGLAAQASFSGSSGPGPAQSAQFAPDPDAGGAPVISYQGVLQEGVNAYSEETADMIFTIYQGGTPGGGGTQVWQESQPGITVSETGYFSTLIGTGSPISQALFSQTGSPMYLEVKVGTQTMSPRQRLAGVPYAFHAYYSGTAIYAALAGTAGHADYADDAGDAETLDGQDSSEFLDKATYDCDTNNVVDHAALADLAIYANDADKLDNHDWLEFMLKADYDDGIRGDGFKVDEADYADNTGSWVPQMTAGGAITAGDVVGIDEDGALVTGAGYMGKATPVTADKTADLDIARVSDTMVAVAYTDSGDGNKEKACLCEISDGGWACGTPVEVESAATTYTDIACFDIDEEKYVLISYKASFKARLWLGQVNELDRSLTVTGTTTVTSVSEVSMDKIDTYPAGDRFLMVYNTSYAPTARIGLVKIGSSPPFDITGPEFLSSSTEALTDPACAAIGLSNFAVIGRYGTGKTGGIYIGTMVPGSKAITGFIYDGAYYVGSVEEAVIEAYNTTTGVLIPFINKNYYWTDYQYGCYVNGANNNLNTQQPFMMSTIDSMAMDIHLDSSQAAIINTNISDSNSGVISMMDINITGHTINWGAERVFTDLPIRNSDITWLDANSMAVVYNDIFDNQAAKIVYLKPNWIEPVGIAKKGGGIDSIIDVAVGGVVDGSTYGWDLLTPGAIYYGTVSGELTTENTGCKIGRAISQTEIALSIDAAW